MYRLAIKICCGTAIAAAAKGSIAEYAARGL